MKAGLASHIESVLAGGGAAGDVLRAVSWATNILGPPSEWPISLRALVRAMLNTRQPTCIFWGPDLINLYNDGFIPILGEKHPLAMGQRAEECWRDAWPTVGGLLKDVFTQGTAVLFAEMLVPIVREGRLQEAWWNYSYSPVFDDAGAVAGVLVVATETTNAVAVRKQLEAAKVEAEAASVAKDGFLATVSHELRTPLNAILGWSRILRDKPDPAKIEKGLAIIERNASAQAKLIEDILNVSQIIAGKVVLDLRRVQLSNVVQNAVDSVRPAATAKRIRIDLTIEDASLDLIADEVRLQQVVWNLLANAVKFTPRGGEIRVTGGKKGSGMRICVEDTGKGIAADFLPYVFERFRQDDAPTTRRFAGLGLGLAIVRHLVELHGGTVEARSEGAGRGAAFDVYLPIRAIEPREPPAVVEHGMAIDLAPQARLEDSLRGIRVLVVDDEDDARDLVATVLKEAGATVAEASSVAGAMSVLASCASDVVVSDIGMPSEDGYSLIQRLRSEAPASTRDTPALALTAYARPEDRGRAMAAGFQEYAAKPIDPYVLVRIVATLARRPRG